MMTTDTPKAAVLWTGGKDSALAMAESVAAGAEIAALLTFAPARPQFAAHPIAVMQAQAQAMGVPHRIIPIADPYRENYIAAIRRLREEDGIGTLITGDIDLVDGLPNWVRECCQGLDVEVLTPLWGRGRADLMHSLLTQGFEVVFSLVKSPWLDETWVGRTIDAEALRQLAVLHEQNGIDLCGENGEFHTLVLDGPLFRRKVRLDLLPPGRRDNMMFLNVARAYLASK